MAPTLNLLTMNPESQQPLRAPKELEDHPIFRGPHPVGMISADNPKFDTHIEGGTQAMAKELERLGLKYELTNGKYNGTSETSFIVHGPSREQLMDLGGKFGQESVVFSHNGNHELIYTNGANKGKWNPGLPGGEFFRSPPADAYTQIPQRGFLRLNFDWDTYMDLPQTQDVSKAEIANALTETINKFLDKESDATIADVKQGLAKAIQNRIDAFTAELVELRKKETKLHPKPDLPGAPVPVEPVEKCGNKCKGKTKKGELSLDLAPVKDTSDKKPAVPEKTKEIDTTEGSGGEVTKGKKMKKGVLEFSGEDIGAKSGNVGGTSDVKLGQKSSTIPHGLKKPVAPPANETTFAPSSSAPSGLSAPKKSTIPTGLRRPAAAPGVGMTSSGQITGPGGTPATVRPPPAPMRFSEKDATKKPPKHMEQNYDAKAPQKPVAKPVVKPEELVRKGAEGVPEAKPPTAPGGKPAKPPSGNTANKPVKQAPAAPKPIKPMKTGVPATPSVTAPGNVNKP